MDTGTSLTMGPVSQVNGVQQAVNLDVRCSNVKKLPTLKFVMDAADNKTFEIVLKPEDYAEENEGTCGLAFQGIQLPPNLGQMWVFGQGILRKYYTVYDYTNSRVGIAVARHTSRKRPPPTTAPVPTQAPPKEKCEDDNSGPMTWGSMPGCKSFQQMGYCKRFPPVAHHYCPLSCEFCTVREASSAVKTAVEPTAEVRGSGLTVSNEKRIFFGKARKSGMLL
jgi:hypothetical protein